MAKSSKIKVMISSRCLDSFPQKSKRTLSEIRKDVKAEIESSCLFNKELFEVWINEAAPPSMGSWDSWDTCIKAVKDCDILIALYNGHAGWARNEGEIGICHAELMTALDTAPAKVRLIELGEKVNSEQTDVVRNNRFERYFRQQSLFRGGNVNTEVDLKERVKEAVYDALINLTRSGVREASKGKFHSGDALNWSRLDFSSRQRSITEILRDCLLRRHGAKGVGSAIAIPIESKPVLFVPDAIPAALSVAAAREMVGQPFLRDHKHFPSPKTSAARGPVHFIGCHKTVTEAQAQRLLGFPDATIVTAPFGIYLADDIQKIQVVLIANCRDETTTRHGVQRFFEWLDQTGEAPRMATRAESRRKIVKAIAAEQR